MKLVLYPNKALLTPCEDVKDFNNDLHTKLDAMWKIMKDNSGMGLAANQVGLSDKIFIIQSKAGKRHEFINPTILEQSGNVFDMEGCLSTPGYFIPIVRPDYVKIKAYNRHGEEFIMIANDYDARCVLHENEHINGKFYFDNVTQRELKRDIKKKYKV